MRVFVINLRNEPLMPTTPQKARKLLKQNKAKVITVKPFTIQLLYATGETKQPCTLGLDSSYQKVGVSVITTNAELFSATITLLKGMIERLQSRNKYRRQRRSRKRHRKPRFDNRKRNNGWLAPSIQHKLDSHFRIIEFIKKLLPITSIIIEVASFDIQKIKNPEITGKEYQQGEQQGYWNLREYILHRDNHQCQNLACKNKSQVLEIHHIGFWKNDMTDRPGNLITLCTHCHTPANHKESGFLYGWQPKLKSYRSETFMSIVRWRLVNNLLCQHTYGYIAKSNRINQCLKKSHINDAFIIAGGSTEKRTTPVEITQLRRNNRSLEKFYDAQYIDIRTSKKVSGQDLFSGRRTRNKNLNIENLRQYRGIKLSKGRRSIRKQRYFYQPNDLVKFTDKIYTIKGTHNKGSRVILKETNKSVNINNLHPYKFSSGLVVT